MTSASTFSDGPAERSPAGGPPPGAATVGGPAYAGPPDWEHLPSRRPPAADRCWLHREPPVPGQPTVIVHRAAIAQLEDHAASALHTELGGALLGQAYRFEDRLFVEVQAALPAVSPDQGPAHFTFDADTWSCLQRDRSEHFPGLDMIGWFHTHPALGVFYSSDDVVVHTAAFTLPWHVGLVIDPVSREAGFFGWIRGQLAPFAGCFELLEPGAQPMLPWQVVRTAVWYDGLPEEAESPAPADHVVTPANQWPRLLGPSPRTALLAGAAALLAVALLAVAWLWPLHNRVDELEALSLALAARTLAEDNVAGCPDPRLRLLLPVAGDSLSPGTAVDILGTADHPDASRYQVEVRPEAGEQWTLLQAWRGDNALGTLATWNTTGYLPGTYTLRLKAVDNNNVRLAGTERCEITVTLQP